MKVNKNLLKQRFEKSLISYKENSIVQSQMAKNLIELLMDKEHNKFDTVYEFGAGAGILTDLITQNITLKKFYANDIIEGSKPIVQSISKDIEFIHGDIERIQHPINIDLIISNAAIQWVQDIESLFTNLHKSLNKNGILAFTTFGNENFKEINSITNKGLEYINKDKLTEIASKYFTPIAIQEEIVQLRFNTPRDVLKHIKNSGTNSITPQKWTKSDLKIFEDKYNKEFAIDDGVSLTYHPYYFILKKVD